MFNVRFPNNRALLLCDEKCLFTISTFKKDLGDVDGVWTIAFQN